MKLRSSLATRREFLKVGTGVAGTVALATILPRPLEAQLGRQWEPVPPVNDPRIKSLLLDGLGAAKSAGANYAEVRFTHTIDRSVSSLVLDSEELYVGIRALVNGYWGFAAGPVISKNELVRLGRSATYQAQTNALGKVRQIDLAPVPPVTDGHWIMPVKIDPFSVHPLAIQDYLGGLKWQIYQEAELGKGEELGLALGVDFSVQERALGTTEGMYVTQRLYRTSGEVDLNVVRMRPGDSQNEIRGVDLLSPATAGWELFVDQPIRERALQLILDARADMELPIRPVEPGRFGTVLDASSVASLVSESIGSATELDRALGYEANATGTSYLNDPLTMLDAFVMGSPALTVTANRSDPGAAATVQWDDEGVIPKTFTVVEHGLFRNYHYTREGAGWLRAGGIQRPFQSLGVAHAPSAVDAPLPHMANLVVAPGVATADERTLMADTGKGIAVRAASANLDFQQRSGLLMGRMYEIKDGKRVARLPNGGIVFNTTQLWKSLLAVGGASNAKRYGLSATKGEPAQSAYHSVTTGPAMFKELTLIDLQKR